MSKMSGRSFGSDFRQFFIRGLVILLPSVLTIWILVQAYRFVDLNIAEPLNRLTRFAVIQVVPHLFVSETSRPDWYVITDQELEAERQRRLSSSIPTRDIKNMTPAEISELENSARRTALRSIWERIIPLRFLGLAMAIILFYLAGRVFGGLIGRRIAERFELLLARVPGFKQIYPHVKQVVDFIFGDHRLEFNRVALVEYPRKGIWSLGLVTGKPSNQWMDTAGEDLVTLFIPSSPTPFTGYTIAVPRDEVIEIDVSIEEAIRFSVSGGVVVPPDRAAKLLAGAKSGQKAGERKLADKSASTGSRNEEAGRADETREQDALPHVDADADTRHSTRDGGANPDDSESEGERRLESA